MARATSAASQQTPAEIAQALESFLAEHPGSVLLEDGKALFDLREARYTLSTEHGRCTLQLWSEERNLVRRVSGTDLRAKVLRLATHRFGQAQAKTLELAADRDRRTPTTREATRTRYGKVLERALLRHFAEWRPEPFHTSMDLTESFGPAYARGLLRAGSGAGTRAWAVIGVNDEETATTIDGILTFGILWLEHCQRESAGRRLIEGLKLVLPPGTGAVTLARMAWLKAERWELLECDQREESLTPLDVGDHSNLASHLVHAPNEAAARERFASAVGTVMGLVPEAYRAEIELRLRTATYLAFLLHGLEFARARMGAAADSFNRTEEISFGAGPAETLLTPQSEAQLRELVERLCERRSPAGNQRDPLYRMQPERWLEGEVRRDLSLMDTRLDPQQVYAQVPAFAAHDRGMMDLLAVEQDGRLAVLELKAAEDPQLALQGLDYWIRVRWHHAQHPDPATGLGEFARHGYFGGVALAAEAPRLYLVAPALRIHSATEVVLRHLSPRVDWVLVALDERWRRQIKVVWRRRPGDPQL